MWIDEKFVYGIAFCLVLLCAVFDIKKRVIPIRILIIGGMLGLGICLGQMYQTKQSAMDFMMTFGCSLLPGSFLLLLGFLTGEKVGYGDGLLLLVVGLFLGFYPCLLILCSSLVLLSLCALILLCLRKVNKSSRLPFVPFLAMGMGVGFFVL